MQRVSEVRNGNLGKVMYTHPRPSPEDVSHHFAGDADPSVFPQRAALQSFGHLHGLLVGTRTGALSVTRQEEWKHKVDIFGNLHHHSRGQNWDTEYIEFTTETSEEIEMRVDKTKAQETAQFLQAAGISKAQETPRVTVPPVGCFGMGCAGDRYTRDDLLWVNPSRQLRPHSCLIALPKSDGERPGRAKVRKLMD
ncbi:hypothetical protein TURU_161379 [Turdus rufiventris]|nr:hypothetical protein TURU_161379 [Turdus rufiventris]